MQADPPRYKEEKLTCEEAATLGAVTGPSVVLLPAIIGAAPVLPVLVVGAAVGAGACIVLNAIGLFFRVFSGICG